jgi:hypothetical protein
MFKVLFSYGGWQSVNYVLNDVKNPVRTLKIAGPLGLGITSTLYIFANVSYFAYANLTSLPTTTLKRHPMQRIVKEGHSRVRHDCRLLVLQERFWDPGTTSANGVRGTEVRPRRH